MERTVKKSVKNLRCSLLNINMATKRYPFNHTKLKKEKKKKTPEREVKGAKKKNLTLMKENEFK